jgi:hypothetical protein
MSPRPIPFFATVPPTHRIRHSTEGLTITVVPRAKQHDQLYEGEPWSHGAVPYPDEVDPDSVKIHAAAASEWSVDVLVEFSELGDKFEQPQLQVWRVSPWRVRRATDVLKPTGSIRLAGPVTIESDPASAPLGSVVFPLEDVRPETTTPVSVHVSLLDGSVLDMETAEPKDTLYDLLISYKSIDHPGPDSLPERFVKSLSDLRIWMDKSVIASDFLEEINRGIERSRAFLILWTDHTPDDKGRVGRFGDPVINQSREIDLIFSHVKTRKKPVFLCYLGSGNPDLNQFPQLKSHQHVMNVPPKEVASKIRQFLTDQAAKR